MVVRAGVSNPDDEVGIVSRLGDGTSPGRTRCQVRLRLVAKRFEVKLGSLEPAAERRNGRGGHPASAASTRRLAQTQVPPFLTRKPASFIYSSDDVDCDLQRADRKPRDLAASVSRPSRNVARTSTY